LVGVEGEQLGIVKIYDALRQAEEADLDLVEIAPTAQPPVCKVMDYGKFKYQESKKQHEAKLKQKQVQIKEIKFVRVPTKAITRSSCATSSSFLKTVTRPRLHCVFGAAKWPIRKSA